MHFKPLILAGCVALGMALPAAAAPGAAAPDFAIADTSGKPVKLSDYRGKFVVLEWTNPECPFVRKHYNSKNMQELQKEWGAKDVVWLTINSTNQGNSEYKSAAQMNAWIKDRGAAPCDVIHSCIFGPSRYS